MIIYYKYLVVITTKCVLTYLPASCCSSIQALASSPELTQNSFVGNGGGILQSLSGSFGITIVSIFDSSDESARIKFNNLITQPLYSNLVRKNSYRNIKNRIGMTTFSFYLSVNTLCDLNTHMSLNHTLNII